MPKPTKLPRWEPPPGNIVEPHEQYKNEGFLPAERIPAEYFNWLFHWLYRWAAYLDGLTDELLVWTKRHVFKAGLEVEGPSGLPAVKATGDASAEWTIRATGAGSCGGVYGRGGTSDGLGIAGVGSGSGYGGAFSGGDNDGSGLRADGGGENGIGVLGLGGVRGPGGVFEGGELGGIGVSGKGGTPQDYEGESGPVPGEGAGGVGGQFTGGDGRGPGKSGGAGVVGVGGSSAEGDDGPGGDFTGTTALVAAGTLKGLKVSGITGVDAEGGMYAIRGVGKGASGGFAAVGGYFKGGHDAAYGRGAALQIGSVDGLTEAAVKSEMDAGFHVGGMMFVCNAGGAYSLWFHTGSEEGWKKVSLV